MEKLIEVSWSGKNGEPHLGDALVLYERYDEDGKIVNAITDVFLPEYVPIDQYEQCKEEVIREFHS